MPLEPQPVFSLVLKRPNRSNAGQWNPPKPIRVSDPEVNAARGRPRSRSIAMLGWAVTFLVIALIAAVLGFGGIAGFAVELAKIVFVVAIILFVISAIFGLMRGRSPTLP
jgi:uncharacterized membrane protein YtjA (UPF0391 family)